MRSSQLLAITLVLGIAACASGPLPGPPEPVTSRSLADSYLLVHGMAAGALSADGVSQANLDEMVRLDHAALLAVGASVVQPQSVVAQNRATGAIRSLAAYAEAVGAGNPAPVGATPAGQDPAGSAPPDRTSPAAMPPPPLPPPPGADGGSTP